MGAMRDKIEFKWKGRCWKRPGTETSKEVPKRPNVQCRNVQKKSAETTKLEVPKRLGAETTCYLPERLCTRSKS